MFTGLRVNGPIAGIDATSISDLKNLLALHNNERVAVTVDLDELIYALGAPMEDGNVADMQDEIEELEQEIDGLEQEVGELTSDLNWANDEIRDLDNELEGLLGVQDELEEALDRITELQDELLDLVNGEEL